MKPLIFLAVVAAMFFLPSCKDEQTKAKDASTNAVATHILQLKQAVKANPDSATLRLDLVDALDSAAQYQEAVAQMDSLIIKDSVNNSLWQRMGLLFEHAKDTTLAIRAYTRSVNIYPAADAQLYLANLLAERRDPLCLQIVNSLSRQTPERAVNASCDFIAGVYNARINQPQQAIMLFDRCIQQNIKYTEAYIEKGQILLDQKKIAEALKVFETCSAANQTYADGYYYQAKCYELLNKKEEAIANYQKSLTFDANLKEAEAALKRLK
jgi:tetratricopeptide (TPR) repeat protein